MLRTRCTLARMRARSPRRSDGLAALSPRSSWPPWRRPRSRSPSTSPITRGAVEKLNPKSGSSAAVSASRCSASAVASRSATNGGLAACRTSGRRRPQGRPAKRRRHQPSPRTRSLVKPFDRRQARTGPSDVADEGAGTGARTRSDRKVDPDSGKAPVVPPSGKSSIARDRAGRVGEVADLRASTGGRSCRWRANPGSSRRSRPGASRHM